MYQPPPGYEHVSTKPLYIPPPVVPSSTSAPPPNFDTVTNYVALTDDQIRTALLEFASENCCYSKKPAKELAINDIQRSGCFKYTLQTFGEERQTNWTSEPYRMGDFVDSSANGVAPPPWNVPVPVPPYFKDETTKVPVPHTAYVRPCINCNGTTRVSCTHCHASGRISCPACASSDDQNETCSQCQSRKYLNCQHCGGNGQTNCMSCKMMGNMKHYVSLTVTWRNHVEHYFSENAVLPKELMIEASGHVAFEDQRPQVWPISHFPERSINEASKRLVNKHKTAFPKERIIQQHHKVQMVPISEVTYTWEDRTGHFYVYGLDNKVFFPDYPGKCCGCCTLL